MNVLGSSPVMSPEMSNGEAMAGGQSPPAATLTIRLIMQGKEVGSIIGKKGDNIKRFREESGAKITISDGSCPERIVTITGSTDAILRAFTLIARKFEEVNALFAEALNSAPPQQNGTKATNGTIPTVINGNSAVNGNGIVNGQPSNGPLSGVSLKLVIPASQCGSLIGKAGAKIKEIREMTGANIQVASDMLPNSTERAVTLTGTADSITKSIYQISCVMLESPPKGPTIPYRPKPAMPPVFFAGGQAYTIQGQFAIPHPDLTKLHRLALQHAPLLPGQTVTSANLASLANSVAIAAASSNGSGTNLGAGNVICGGGTAATSSSSSSASAGMGASSISAEMTIPNDIIGCVIGKGGSKINEIRQLSGASIKISTNGDDSKERVVIISGTAEAINLAQYLIATRTAAILQGTNPPLPNLAQLKSLVAGNGQAFGQHSYPTALAQHPQHHHSHHHHPASHLQHHRHQHSAHPSAATAVVYR